MEDECIKAFVQEMKESAWRTKKAQMKDSIKTRTEWLKEAQMTFNKYIRMRDKGKGCISCSRNLADKFDAGHYFSSGGHKAVTFDEDNVHGQCVHCNQHLSGNLLQYQIGIQQRIGADRLIQLHEKAYTEKSWSIAELQDIKKKYQKKIKEML